jgi:hypothetical protein
MSEALSFFLSPVLSHLMCLASKTEVKLCQACSNSCGVLDEEFTIPVDSLGDLPFGTVFPHKANLQCRSSMCVPGYVSDPKALCRVVSDEALLYHTRRLLAVPPSPFSTPRCLLPPMLSTLHDYSTVKHPNLHTATFLCPFCSPPSPPSPKVLPASRAFTPYMVQKMEHPSFLSMSRCPASYRVCCTHHAPPSTKSSTPGLDTPVGFPRGGHLFFGVRGGFRGNPGKKNWLRGSPEVFGVFEAELSGKARRTFRPL